MPCHRCLVSGRVQGVFFRASTRDRARALGLTGYARNLPDGRVEVLACGPVESLDALSAWLKVGPPAATVLEIQCRRDEVTPPADFTTD